MGRHGRGMPGPEPPGNVSQHAYASQRNTIYQAGGNHFISIGGVSTAARRRRIAGAVAAAGCLVVILTVTALIASHFTGGRRGPGPHYGLDGPAERAAVAAAAASSQPQRYGALPAPPPVTHTTSPHRLGHPAGAITAIDHPPPYLDRGLMPTQLVVPRITSAGYTSAAQTAIRAAGQARVEAARRLRP
jgi:hypothetical protein